MLILNNDNNHIGDVILMSLKTAPPITVTGMIIYGYNVQDWACILTIIWVLIQIYLAIHNYIINSKKVCPICRKKHY